MPKKKKKIFHKPAQDKTVVSIRQVEGGFKLETAFVEPTDTEQVMTTMLFQAIYQRGKEDGRKEAHAEWEKKGGILGPDGKPIISKEQGN